MSEICGASLCVTVHVMEKSVKEETSIIYSAQEWRYTLVTQMEGCDGMSRSAAPRDLMGRGGGKTDIGAVDFSLIINHVRCLTRLNF